MQLPGWKPPAAAKSRLGRRLITLCHKSPDEQKTIQKASKRKRGNDIADDRHNASLTCSLIPQNIFHLSIDAIFSRRYSVRIILVSNHVLRTTRPASPSHGFELARKDAAPPAVQPSEPSSRQSNKVQCPQAARAVFRLGATESNGGK